MAKAASSHTPTPPAPKGEQYYIIRAVSGQESKVQAYLLTEIERQGLKDLLPEVLIPKEKVVEQRNGKKTIREKTIFPGYIVIKADIGNGEVKHTITSTPGVIGFLTEDGGKDKNKEPKVLTASDVQKFLGKIDESAVAEPRFENPYAIGDSVKVIEGALATLLGIVSDVFPERKKLNVVVKFFGRDQSMELSYNQVEKSV